MKKLLLLDTMKKLLLLLMTAPIIGFGQCVSGDCENGYGTYLYLDGEKYIGKWKDNKFNGEGTLIFKDGKYVGEFEDGRYHGHGTFTNTKGDKYVGDFQDGLFDGKGTYTWGESPYKGDKYIGEWKDGKHNGQGTYAWGEGDNKGDKYVGGFINNKKTGQGTCTYANGEKYVGEWKDGKSHGQGTFTMADGIIKEGLFENGKFIEEEIPVVEEPVEEIEEKEKKKKERVVLSLNDKTEEVKKENILGFDSENGQSESELPTESTKVISEDVVHDNQEVVDEKDIERCGTEDGNQGEDTFDTKEKSNIAIYTLYIIIFVIVIIIIIKIRSQLRKTK